MNKLFYFIILLLFFPIIILFNQETKPIKTGKQYLVVIALNKYKNRLPLNNRVENAKKIKNLLYSKYQIDELIELYDFDATYSNVRKVFTELQRYIKKEDSVIFYYSGHGFADPASNEVYWLPYDSGINEYLKNLWFSNTELINSLNKINAKQIFVISDSSFNQDLLEPVPLDGRINFNLQYFTDSYSKTSRQFLCSGEIETGIDKTEFSQVLINTLRIIRNNYIDPVMIFQNIKNRLNKTKPSLSINKDLGHEDNGSFVLFKRQKELSIKELEMKDKAVEKTEKTEPEPEKEVIKPEKTEPEKEKVVIIRKLVPFKDLHPINKAGRVLLPVSAPIMGSGLILLGVDIAYMLTALDDAMYNGNSYEEYIRVYRIHMIMFITSIAISSVGLTGVIISIPLIAFKEGWFKNRKQNLSLNFNYDLNNNFSLFMRYRL
jgi:hypothetical protein